MKKKNDLDLTPEERNEIALKEGRDKRLTDIPGLRSIQKIKDGPHTSALGPGCIKTKKEYFTIDDLTERPYEDRISGSNYKECDNFITKIQRGIALQMKIPCGLLQHYSDVELGYYLSFIRVPISNTTLVDFLKLSSDEKNYVWKNLRVPISTVLKPFAECGSGYRAAYTRAVEENIADRQRHFQLLRDYMGDLKKPTDK